MLLLIAREPIKYVDQVPACDEGQEDDEEVCLIQGGYFSRKIQAINYRHISTQLVRDL